MNEGDFCPVAQSPVSQMLTPRYDLFGLTSNWIWKRLIFSFLVSVHHWIQLQQFSGSWAQHEIVTWLCLLTVLQCCFFFQGFFFFFSCWPYFKVFIEFVTILLLFSVLVFWPWGRWNLSSPTKDRIFTLALESEVLTTELPGKVPACLCFVTLNLNIRLI